MFFGYTALERCLPLAKSNVAITLYAMAFPTIIPLLVGGYLSLRSDNKLTGLNDRQASNKALKGLVAYLVSWGFISSDSAIAMKR